MSFLSVSISIQSQVVSGAMKRTATDEWIHFSSPSSSSSSSSCLCCGLVFALADFRLQFNFKITLNGCHINQLVLTIYGNGDYSMRSFIRFRIFIPHVHCIYFFLLSIRVIRNLYCSRFETRVRVVTANVNASHHYTCASDFMSDLLCLRRIRIRRAGVILLTLIEIFLCVSFILKYAQRTVGIAAIGRNKMKIWTVAD